MTPESKRRRPGGAESLELELYVRSLTPTECRNRQADVVRRLAQLEVDGRIDDVTVEVWGRQLAVDDAHRTEPGRRISDRIDAFRTWAADTGRSVDRQFPVERVSSTLTGDEYTRIGFPTMTLAEYEGDDLRFVSPCTDDGAVCTVEDRLTAIESTERAPPRRLVGDVEADE